MRRASCFRLLLTLCLALPALPAAAQGVYFADSSRPDNTGDGLSWATAKKTLQAAIDATATQHQVWARQGRYNEGVTLRSGVMLYGGFAGAETRLEDRATSAVLTTIDGAGARDGIISAYHVVTMDGVTTTTLDGLTLTGGDAKDQSNDANGGGILCLNSGASNVVANCRIVGNFARNGGGVYCGAGAAPRFVRCTIAGNRATLYGGGIHCDAGSSPVFTGCTISANTADGGRGGGGALLSSAGATLRSCLISGNSASHGGGLYCRYAPTITHCTISSNYGYSRAGGVGFDGSTGIETPILDSNIFDGNKGEAIYKMTSANTPKVTNCLFHNQLNAYFMETRYDPYNYILEGTKYPKGTDINAGVTGASGNRDGNPRYAMDGPGATTGTLTADAVIITTTSQIILTDAKAAFAPGALVGRLINIDTSQQRQGWITSNTATRIIATGVLDRTKGKSGARYQLIDCHLLDQSPALDSGSPAGAPAIDYDGEVRPGEDGLYDVGADEAPGSFAPYDVIAPVSAVSPLAAATTTSTLSVAFTASDAETAVRDVQLYYRRNGGAWTAYGPPAAVSPIAFDAALTGGEGTYEFYTRATDVVGNVEAAPAQPDALTCIISSFSGARVFVNRAAAIGGGGASWGGAFPTIGMALTIAQKFGVKEVWVAQGRYAEAITIPSGVALYGGFAGDETTLTQRRLWTHETTIDARTVTPRTRVVKMLDKSRLDGFNVTGGSVKKNETNWDWDVSGGGIYASAIGTAIANCRVYCNEADYGGGIYVDLNPGASWSTITSCFVTGNYATRDGGGILSYGRLNVYNCVISGNWAQWGGGIKFAACPYYITSFDGNVMNCTIETNTAATYGGGVLYAPAHHPLGYSVYISSLTVTNCIFNNNAINAIDQHDYGPLPIRNCLFNANAGDAYLGNAVRNGTAINSASGCSGNLAGQAAFTHETGKRQLGALKQAASYSAQTGCSTLTVTTPTLTAGSLKGAIINADLTQRRQTVVVDNTAATITVLGDVTSWAHGGDSWLIFDYHLNGASAALDVGASSNSGAYAPATDLEGNPRPVDLASLGGDGPGAGYDIGAYELQSLKCRLTVTTSALGAVTKSPSLGSYDVGATVTLTARPNANSVFTRWSGNVPAGHETDNPLILLMNGAKTLTPLFARQTGTVVVKPVPVTASWSFVDGDGKTHAGSGDDTVTSVPTGLITLTWGALANYAAPAPNPRALGLAPGATLTFGGAYRRQTGTVVIAPDPASTAWALVDGGPVRRTGTGPARLTGILSGAVSITWTAPAGFDPPLGGLNTQTLTGGGVVTFTQFLVPVSGARRTARRVIQYLLGYTTNGAGLDYNSDRKIDSGDLIRVMR